MNNNILIIFLVILTILTIYSLFYTINEVNAIKHNHSLLLKNLTNLITNLTEENKKLSHEISNLKVEVTNTKNKMNEVEHNIERLKERVERERIVLPSFSELLHFLEEDKTDLLEYRKDEFNCVDFSNTFIKNFLKKGFFACEATIYIVDENNNSEEGAHSLVAVNTTTMGLVFVEPQNDKIIYSIEIGENYCNLVGWDCNYKIVSIKHCFK